LRQDVHGYIGDFAGVYGHAEGVALERRRQTKPRYQVACREGYVVAQHFDRRFARLQAIDDHDTRLSRINQLARTANAHFHRRDTGRDLGAPFEGMRLKP
jgi:hypothetical protein